VTTTTTPDISRFCSVCAQQAGLDPIGYAHSYKHMLAVETPLPWPIEMYEQPGVLPQELLDLRKRLIEAYEAGESLGVYAFILAPDKAYSAPGHRRVISYKRPEGLFARFLQEEYLVPEAETGPLCWALLFDQGSLPRFEVYRQPDNGVRDLMVCTHGAVDAACAKFGFPIYRQLRALADTMDGRLRIWRINHFGGHVFAPTLLDMPEFRYWGYIGKEEAPLLAMRECDVARLRGCYRGWAGLEDELVQVVERELLVRYGWAWINYPKRGRIVAKDPGVDPNDHDAHPTWAEVELEYAAPDGSERGIYAGRVELQGHVTTIYSTGSPETYPYPQYAVTRLEHVEAGSQESEATTQNALR